MKKFLLKVISFFLIIIIIDILSGIVYGKLRKLARSGITYNYEYIADSCANDILILGSSKAARHYNPQIIGDSLNMSCYNCGEPGCGIITALARYRMIKCRHMPKMIIYELTPGYDYFDTDDYSKYLLSLKPYANKECVRAIFDQFGDDLDPLRLCSKMYMNNSTIIQVLTDCIRYTPYNGGFQPLNGRMNAMPKLTNNSVPQKIDSIKLNCLERFIQEVKRDSVFLCFVASPECSEMMRIDDNDYNIGVNLCKKYNVQYFDKRYIDGISNNPSLFHDKVHLNGEGASVFSKEIIYDLKNVSNSTN